MLHMKHPCIILEGVVCNAEYARVGSIVRERFPVTGGELWLERVEVATVERPVARSMRFESVQRGLKRLD